MRRLDLVADCGACAGLCCVATSFEASDDFAFSKPAGVRCRHLDVDDRCAIHAVLTERGCSGCVIYDCYGAGQRATHAFADRPTRERDQAFIALREVHELAWLLARAKPLCERMTDDRAAALASELDAFAQRLTGPAATIVRVDLDSERAQVHALLRRIGAALGGRAHWGRGTRAEAVIPIASLRRDRCTKTASIAARKLLVGPSMQTCRPSMTYSGRADELDDPTVFGATRTHSLEPRRSLSRIQRPGPR